MYLKSQWLCWLCLCVQVVEIQSQHENDNVSRYTDNVSAVNLEPVTGKIINPLWEMRFPQQYNRLLTMKMVQCV